ncbi:MAG: TolC family protein [Paraprevotella sp.]|nr:TolC family protein [Paraprevotella sp.]
MRKKIACIILSLCALSASARTDSLRTKEHMTLRKCLERGLDSNFSILMVKNRQEVSDNNATRANAGMLPTVDLSTSYSGDLNTTRTTPRATGITSTERGAYDATVDAGIDLNWTIFNGFSVWTNYKQLKLLKEQGELQTRITIEDYVASLTAEYYNYIQERIRLNNFRYAMSLSRERMRIVEVRYHIGNFSRLDYLQAKVDFNADSAQYMKQREVLNSSRIKLNELMANDDVTGLIGIRDTVIDVNPDLHYEELWQATLAANASLLMADKNTEVVKADYKKVMSRDYPYVRLNAGYGYTLNRYELSSTRKRDNWGLNAGITVGFNLFDGKRKMQKKNAELAVKYAELEREDLRLSLKADLNDLWQAYANNWQVMLMERQNVVAAQENYEYANLRYMKGDLSGFEMREAQKSLLDAEERRLVAEYDTKICEISLLQLSGQVLDYLNTPRDL